MKVILRYMLQREYINKILEILTKLMWHEQVWGKIFQGEHYSVKSPILIGRWYVMPWHKEWIIRRIPALKKKWNKNNKIGYCQWRWKLIEMYYLTFYFQWKAIRSLYKILSNKINKPNTLKSMMFLKRYQEM